VEFEVRNALTLDDTQRFEFITMGEVLEHVEDPLSLLVLLRRLLADGGAAFVSAPTNSPTIDHIHLFEHSDQIREMLAEAGLEIIEECTRYSEPVDEERAKRLKVAQMFAAFVQRRD
jgi:2-polyprenyl-3-methyl-5-hydroxy-6-metoxy-1,4-benzoquinol methylase